MSNAALMAPVFAMIALTFFIILKMGIQRMNAIKSRTVRIKDIALSEQGWTDDVKKISNSYASQMQLPLVFYIVVGFFVLLGKVDLAAVVLAWAFVLTRAVHFFIHTSSNHVPKRFMAFLFGIIVLIAMWIWLAFRVYVLG